MQLPPMHRPCRQAGFMQQHLIVFTKIKICKYWTGMAMLV